MIKRDIEQKISDSLKLKEVTILIGARQVGKTTILEKIIANIKNNNEKVLYLNLDIETDTQYFESQLILLNRIQLEFGNNKGYVFIDEIQQKEDAGKFLKGLYDMNLPYKFVVTGSGSLELKDKISEALTGRKHLIEMHPVTFNEFLNYKTKYTYHDRLEKYCQIETEKLKLFLFEYLDFGGYPKVVISDSKQQKQQVMNEIFTSYITKDITYLLGVKSPDKFTKMIRLLAVQCGGIINYSQLASNVNISVDTLKDYLWYAIHTFVIEKITPYYTNVKKEITKSPTIYFNDLGMCNFGLGRYGFPVRENYGFVFQNFVYHLLRDKYHTVISDVNYWRTKDKAEVDFIVHGNGEAIPVEVKFSELKKAAVTRSYRSFIHKYNPKYGYVVNLSKEENIIIENTEVRFIPYWRLMFL